jgi:hypothetical protein
MVHFDGTRRGDVATMVEGACDKHDRAWASTHPPTAKATTKKDKKEKKDNNKKEKMDKQSS